MFVSKPLLIASGHQSGAGRIAKWMRHVSVRAANPVVRDGIDIGCRVIRAPIETYVSVTQIVCHNNNDVWRHRLPESRRGDKSAKDEQPRQKKFPQNR